jgi:hypothetical protein
MGSDRLIWNAVGLIGFALHLRRPGPAMKAITEILIRGYGNAWKLAEPSDTGPLVQLRVVELEIQGDGKDGYHLVLYFPGECIRHAARLSSLSAAA